MAVAMTGGDVMLGGARSDLLQSALGVLQQAGVEVLTSDGLAGTVHGAHDTSRW